MPSSAFPRWSLIACAVASLALPPAMAAELGEMVVQSHVGQPLSAEIELMATAPGEANGVPVRLASPDVYRGGGIVMEPALQTLTIAPFERDGRRYVRVSTGQAIEAGHVHLYLLLGNGSSAIVRLATLWLTPAPPVVAVMTPARQAPVPVSPVASAPPDAAVLAARARAEGMVRPATVFVAPPAAAGPAVRPAVPSAAPPPVRAPVSVRAPALRHHAAPVAACAPQLDAGQAEACVALDQKNAALNDKLGELEGKLGVLQQALAQPAVALAAAPAGVALPHAKPKPLAPDSDKEKKPGGNGLLWLGIGTLAFLLLTALIVYVLRKRKEAGAAAPSKYWVLLRKPFRRKTQEAVLTQAADEVEAPVPEAEPFSR